MDELSDDSSEDEYEVDMEDSDDDYDSMTDDETEAPEVETMESQKLVADLFTNKPTDPLPQSASQLSGQNPALGDSCLMSFADAFKLFFDGELVEKLCEWVNKRAAQFLTDNHENKGSVNGIIWHPATHGVYTFFTFIMVMALI